MRFLVTADDTTGALETAAACAAIGWRAEVRAAGWEGSVDGPADGPVGDGRGAPLDDHALVVLDLRSRHLPADEAASRLREVASRAASFRAHKIDSTLRGNWASELAAVAHLGRPVLLVPAFPAAGRTCVDGQVLVDGTPVHETVFGHDPRSPVRGSRPAELLRGAVGVRDAAAARTAFADGARLVVGDAVDDDAVARHAALALEHPELVLAGPAAVVTAFAAVAGRSVGQGGRQAADEGWRRRPAPLEGAVLVVSASQHPTAIAQLAELAARGVAVVRPPADADPGDPEAVLDDLAQAARRRLAADPTIATVVVVGGDTTAAMIGRATVHVEGTLGVGVAVGHADLDGRTVRLVTKPGGFGDAGTLVDVLQDVIPR